MKRSIIAYILVLSLVLTAFCPTLTMAAENAQDSIEIFVAPDGNDNGDGSIQNPFATLDGARKKVQQLKKNQGSKIIVNIRGGEYRLTESINFDENDSGTAEKPIVYRAYNGEEVSFLGSVKLNPADFSEVTNPETLAKIPESAHGDVGVLDLKKYGVSSIRAYKTGEKYDNFFLGYTTLQVNGDIQTIARYPNADYNTIEKVYSKGSLRGEMEFSYGDAQGERWVNATDALVTGFFYYSFGYERGRLRSVDTKKGSLVIEPTIYGCLENRFWFIENLLEELDAPGEYFVDRYNMKLYYYPPYSLKNADMEFTTLKVPIVNMTNANYITFNGINFKNTCNIGLNITNCNNINIQNCEISNAGIDAIYMDGGQDCTISGCVIKYTGAKGIHADAGNYDTLEAGNLKMIQNELYACGWVNKTAAAAIEVHGVGNIIEYNTIHYAPQLAIRFYGNDHKIRYNEIYDVMNHGSDGGAIYTGQQAEKRGTEVAYNYIHGAQTYRKIIHEHGTKVLYLDDSQHGVYLHHNLGVGAGEGVQIGGGQDNTVVKNLFVDVYQGLYLDERGMPGQWGSDYTSPGGVTYEGYMKYGRTPLYLERYPELADTMDNGFGTPQGNIVKDNLFVNLEGELMAEFTENFEKYSTVENNIEVDSLPFTDPDNHDYTLPEGSSALAQYPWVKEITDEIVKAGSTNVKSATEDTIRLYYPKNGQNNISGRNAFFSWDWIDGCDYYTLKIATDYKMQNIIAEQDTPYNSAMINGLPVGNKILYWTVEGKMTGMKTQGTLIAKPKFPYVFRTVQYDKINTKSINASLTLAREMYNYAQSIEGPGSFEKEYVEKLGKVVKQAENAISVKGVSQESIDSLRNTLDELIENAENYQDTESLWIRDMGDLLKFPGLWSKELPIENGVLTLGPDSGVMRTGVKMTNSSVLKTKMKFDAGDGWILVGLRQTDPDNYNKNYYGFVLKKDVIEFQRVSQKARKALFLDTIPNPLEANKWYDIEYSVLDTEDGVQVKLVVDGKVLFEGTDTNKEEMVTDDGYLGITCDVNNTYISFKSAKDGVNANE